MATPAFVPMDALGRRTPRRASLPSREAQSPLAPSASAAAVAAWEADAIEPDVSSRGSFYASVQSSTSTDGESSECGSRRRFRSLRVSIRRRRKSSFQYHVPVHLMAQSAGSRRRLSSRFSDSSSMGFPSFCSTSVPGSASTSPVRGGSSDPRRRASAVPSSAPSMLANGQMRRPNELSWRYSSVSDLSGPSFVSAAASQWNNPAKHSVLELSDQDEPVDKFISGDASSSSRRHRAWSKLKAHARLPRIKRAGSSNSKDTTGMFSISFYPWKMEAHGYYSTPEAAAEWVPDTASTRCQLCVAGFNLARRRHHCRLCGRLVCNDCSLQRTFLPFGEDAVRRTTHRSLIKSGEPQRTCDSCATTLKHMVAQHDHRVKQFRVDATAPSASTSGNATTTMATSTLRHSRSCGRASSSLGGGDTMAPPPDTVHQLQLARPRALSKASLARNDELDQVLRARAKSRASAVVSRQYIISSLWLDQWLQFVQMDSSDSVSTQAYPQTRLSMASRGSMSSRRRSSRFALGRRPGPITNYELLDFVNGRLVPRDGLRRSRGTEGTGDYHVISHEVWHVFLRLYGGGPCITIDEEAALENSRSMVHSGDSTPFDTDYAASPPPPQWIIQELHATPAPTQSQPAVSRMDISNALSKSVLKEKPSRVQPTASDERHLEVRPTPTFQYESSKSVTKRPASTTAIATLMMPPPAFTRSTSESHQPPLATDPNGRRKSLTFIGYIKRWRQGDESSRPSGASTTISQVDDDGIVLFDPSKFATQERIIHDDDYEDGVDFSRSCGPERQRDTIAAVSAFAAAAAEARRKSTMSLMRHSTVLTTRETTVQPSVRTA